MSPVIMQPIVGVMLNRCVMVDASRSLSWNKKKDMVGGRHLFSFVHTGTFRWVMTTAVSFPLTETAVCPEPEMALNAYSES